MTQPRTMYRKYKGSMVQAQYCSERIELRYGTFQGSIPLFRDDRIRVVHVYYPLQVLGLFIDWLLMFVNQTQVGADLRVRTVAKRYMRSSMFTASFILVLCVKLPLFLE